jgi:membrane associated rhomboid family serine protease
METLALERTNSTKVTWLFIIACFIVYPLGIQDNFLACSYDNIFLYGKWWTIFTAIFAHGSISHLLGNMLFLFLFGRGLERHIGSTGLFIVFILGGAISMFLSSFYYPHDQPSVGASGAISAILATLMLFNPWRLSLLLNMFPMPLGVAGFTFLMLNCGGFYMARHSLDTPGTHIGYLAHLIGFATGIFFGMILSPDWKKNLILSIIQFICFYLLIALIIYYVNHR